MDKFALFHLYLIFFFLGLGYAVIAVLMGQLIGGSHEAGGHEGGGVEGDVDADVDVDVDAGAEAGGHDFGHEAGGADHDFDHDAGHDLATDHGFHTTGGHDTDADSGGAMPGISPLSPVTLATFVTSFGGVGLILDSLRLPAFVSVPVAGASGFVIAAGVFYLFFRVFSVTQSTSGVSVRQAVGREATVLTAIPERGVGEIAYVLGGRRFNVAACTADGRAIARGASVTITDLKGTRFIVTESASQRLTAAADEGA